MKDQNDGTKEAVEQLENNSVSDIYDLEEPIYAEDISAKHLSSGEIGMQLTRRFLNSNDVKTLFNVKVNDGDDSVTAKIYELEDSRLIYRIEDYARLKIVVTEDLGEAITKAKNHLSLHIDSMSESEFTDSEELTIKANLMNLDLSELENDTVKVVN